MDRVWDTFKNDPKLSMSIFNVKVMQGHEVKETSNWKFYVWDAWYMFLVQISSNAKIDPKTLFKRPKSDEIWKS